jgi:gamma-glutamylcyclotransferase (GGCT)/AIG2-like uncharacterized protein YtfP
MNKNLVFVYGTLKQNRGNHRVMTQVGATFKGKGITKEKYLLHAKGIPFVNKSITNIDGLSNVKGEVYEVSDSALRQLDHFEGHPIWYKREPSEINMEDSTVLTADIYFNDGEEISNIIKSGEY